MMRFKKLPIYLLICFFGLVQAQNIPLPEHPRPDFERSDWANLNGQWSFQFDKENKGALMGCSNPHPHGQIWAQQSIPREVEKKTEHQRAHWEKNGTSLLGDYLEQELKIRERIITENADFVALVPYWAVWPYEVMIIPRKHYQDIAQMTENEKSGFAEMIKTVATKYDNLFGTSFPYSSGIHQRPTDDKEHPEWHFHMSFYPPLLRSATVKKFMVGYEMFANPQRDITAESSADILRGLSTEHYTLA